MHACCRKLCAEIAPASQHLIDAFRHPATPAGSANCCRLGRVQQGGQPGRADRACLRLRPFSFSFIQVFSKPSLFGLSLLSHLIVVVLSFVSEEQGEKDVKDYGIVIDDPLSQVLPCRHQSSMY